MARRRDNTVLLTSAALGAIAGLRSMAAPALLTHEIAEDGDAEEFGPFERILTSERTSQLLAAMAGGEMIADKTPYVPDRTNPAPLIGRAVIGSMTAAAFAMRRHYPPFLPAAIGAISAVASTFAAFHTRRYITQEFRVPDRLIGLAEDAIVMAASKAIADTVEV
jgi:uncharacterized membrane protein